MYCTIASVNATLNDCSAVFQGVFKLTKFLAAKFVTWHRVMTPLLALATFGNATQNRAPSSTRWRNQSQV
jgi:hypothetical protein